MRNNAARIPKEDGEQEYMRIIREWHNSIAFKISLATILLVLVPACIWGYTWYGIMMDRVIENKIQSAELVSTQIHHEIVRKFDIITNYLNNQSMNTDLLRLVTFRPSDSETVRYFMQSLKPSLEELQFQIDDVIAVRVLHKNEELFNVSNMCLFCEDFNEQADIMWKHQSKDKEFIYNVEYKAHGQEMNWGNYSTKDEDVWVFSKFVMAKNSNIPCAILQVVVDNQKFTSTIKELATNSNDRLLVLTWDGETPYSDGIIGFDLDNVDYQQRCISTCTLNDAVYTVLVIPYAEIRSSIISLIPSASFSLSNAERIRMVCTISFTFLGFSCVIVLLWYIFLSRIKALTKSMDEFALNRIITKLPEKGNDEISRLIRHFNRMATRIQETISLERELCYTELVSQIKPHFLINVLDLIRIRADRVGANDIAQNISRVNQYFRHTMMEGNRTTTLTDELHTIVNYVEMVNSIQTNSIQYSITLDAWSEQMADTIYLPALVLQPLVENAVKHGISDMKGGNIYINIKNDGQYLKISIEDNGCGMEQKMVDELNYFSAKNDHFIDRHHLGISNVLRRLRLNYPNACKLEYESYEDVGVSVVVSIRIDSIQLALKANP